MGSFLKFTVPIAVVAALGIPAAFAQEGEIRTSAEKQPERQFGAYLGIGDPYPTLVGVNGAYNIDNHLRASIGYGEVEVTTSVSFDQNGVNEQKIKAETYSAGMDYLFLDSTLRPLVGVRAGYFKVSGNSDGQSFDLQGLTKSTALAYGRVGGDWLTHSGFNLGAGFNIAMLGGHGANFYANMGYFF